LRARRYAASRRAAVRSKPAEHYLEVPENQLQHWLTQNRQMKGLPSLCRWTEYWGRVDKVALAKGLGLLSQDQLHFIEGMARVRNRCAHNVRYGYPNGREENNAKIVEHVTALMDTKLPALKSRLTTKCSCIINWQIFLSNALKTLGPPLATGGLFGILDAVEAPDSAHILGEENT
jgi:hypothetical protein